MKRLNSHVPNSEVEKIAEPVPLTSPAPSTFDVSLGSPPDIAIAHSAQPHGKKIAAEKARRSLAHRHPEVKPKPVESGGSQLPPELNLLAEHCTNPRAKFRPLSRNFNRSARALRRITGERGTNAYDILAQIYGYKGYDELVAELGARGYEGPYDDEHEVYWQSPEGLAHKQTRLARVEGVIKDELPRFFSNYPDRVNWIIETLQLFSSADVQRIAFQKMAHSKRYFPGCLEIFMWGGVTK